MLPYIALLVIFIAMILWQVYSQVEGFVSNVTFNPVVLTEMSTNQDVLNNIAKAVAKLNDLKLMYSTKTFTPTITPQEAILLGYTVTKDASGKETVMGDTSISMLRKKLDDEVKIYEFQLTSAQNDIQSGAVRAGAKVVDRVYADSSLTKEQAATQAIEILKMMNMNNEQLKKKFNAYESIYYRQYPSEAPAPTATIPTTTTTSSTPSTSAPSTTTTAAVPTPAPVTTTMAPSPTTMTTGVPQETIVNIDLTKTKEMMPISQPASMEVKPSQLFTKEMEDRLTQRIVTDFKNEIASSYQLQTALRGGMPETQSPASEATAQGEEYNSTKAAVQLPDMSQYVRKDSIPCWACSVDY